MARRASRKRVEDSILLAIGRIPDSRDPNDRDVLRPAEEILPSELKGHLNETVLTDCAEMFRCIQFCLWNSAALMGLRIFEHICRQFSVSFHGHDYESAPLVDLIDLVMGPDQTVRLATDKEARDEDREVLDLMRRLRNQGMHARRSFDEDLALKICGMDILLMVALHRKLERPHGDSGLVAALGSKDVIQHDSSPLLRVEYLLFESELGRLDLEADESFHSLDREILLTRGSGAKNFISWEQAADDEDIFHRMALSSESFYVTEPEARRDMSRHPFWKSLVGRPISFNWPGPLDQILEIKGADTSLFLCSFERNAWSASVVRVCLSPPPLASECQT